MKLDHPTPAQRIAKANDRARDADDDADEAIEAARLNRDDDTEHRFHLNRARWLRRMAASYRTQAECLQNGPVIGAGDR